jgi:hypothetical protein
MQIRVPSASRCAEKWACSVLSMSEGMLPEAMEKRVQASTGAATSSVCQVVSPVSSCSTMVADSLTASTASISTSYDARSSLNSAFSARSMLSWWLVLSSFCRCVSSWRSQVRSSTRLAACMMACAMLTRRWLSAESFGDESLEERRMALGVSLCQKMVKVMINPSPPYCS